MENTERGSGRMFKDAATIDQLHSLIFNESFFADDIKYDSSESVVIIPFMRCYHWDEHKLVKKSLFREVYELPVLKCELRIYGVEEFKLLNKSDSKRHIFLALEYQENTGRINIKSFMPLELYAYVSSFNIEYIEVKQEGRALFSHGRFPFGWESGPKFEGM